MSASRRGLWGLSLCWGACWVGCASGSVESPPTDDSGVRDEVASTVDAEGVDTTFVPDAGSPDEGVDTHALFDAHDPLDAVDAAPDVLDAVDGLAIDSGPVVHAADCSFASVKSAVSAASTGSTVAIPAGDCNWGTEQLIVPAGISLRGAGKDVTTLRRVGNVPNTVYLIAFDCTTPKRVRFSAMTLVGNGDGAIQDKGLGLLHGCIDFQVFDAKFTHFIFSAVYVGESESQRGVVYGNEFVDNYSADLRNLGYGVVVYGGGTWPALELGTENAVFVEDNHFRGNRHDIASNNGSRYVFRHNTVVATDAVKDFAMTDAHGLSSSPRGSRSWEIYANSYSTDPPTGIAERTAIGMRGGDGVAFDNTMTSTIARPIELMVEGFGCGTYPGPDQIRSAYFWGNTVNGYPNGIDDSCPASLQLGRDYFVTPKPGYAPYAYPHPLRGSP